MFEKKIDKELDLIVNTIKNYVNPKRIILFGSRATDKKVKKYSDYDVAIEGVWIDIRKERLLKTVLDEKLGIFK